MSAHDPSGLPAGIRHWRGRHPSLGETVSSYALVEEGVLLNPLVPDDPSVLDGVELRAIVLTNRLHRRGSDSLGGGTLPVHVPQPGMWDLEDSDLDLHPYGDGDGLPGGLRAMEIGVLSPDEFAVHSPEHRALAVADGVMREGDGPLGTFPDGLLGDDPAAVRRGLGQAFVRACDELEFDHLLLPHGDPIVGDGRERLARFALELARG